MADFKGSKIPFYSFAHQKSTALFWRWIRGKREDKIGSGRSSGQGKRIFPNGVFFRKRGE
jgi:hypothetical protein